VGGGAVSLVETPELSLAVPEGLDVRRDLAGVDLAVVVGDTAVLVQAHRDREAAVTLDEHLARTRPAPDGPARHLVDEAPIAVGGTPGWWTLETLAHGGRAIVLDTWYLVHRGLGWTVTVQVPWMDVHRLRQGAMAIAGTLAFRPEDA
jgi:hypothetical protein